METNFFQQIADLQLNAAVTIALTTREGVMTVSVLCSNPVLTNGAARLLPPAILRGTPEELDKAFFASIEAPVRVTDGIFTNAEQYQLAQQQAQQALKEKREKESAKPATAKVDDKTAKYNAQMKKVDDLEAQKKYGEAIMQLPKIEDYPDQEEEINERTEELWAKRREKEGTMF